MNNIHLSSKENLSYLLLNGFPPKGLLSKELLLKDLLPKGLLLKKCLKEIQAVFKRKPGPFAAECPPADEMFEKMTLSSKENLCKLLVDI